ncbi:MAG: protein translocase subunit SecD [Caldiserica bacterium]|nr:protein translocase subunit SecD [Caldisericota bacterium]MDH7562948.1 protein translocase subunit SecD [Caldisericota bacterium]
MNRIGLRLALIILVILGGIASFYFLPIKFGLDLAGGVHFTLEAVDTPGAPLTKEGVQAAQRVISQRVNAMGLAEPIIQGQSGDKWNRIIVDLPGYQDPARAREILQRTAVLEFIVAREKVTITASDLTSTTTQGETLTPTIIVEPRSQIPMILVYYGPDGQKKYAIVGTNSGNEPGFETLEKAQQTITPTPGLKLELPRGEVALTGKYLVDARARYGQSGEAEVAIKFNDEGTRLFAQLTKEMVRKMIYTVLDNDIVFAGTVQEEIPSGEARLTGRFSIDEASNIATLLRGGALPVKLVIAEERTVAPTLGKAAIDASLIAGIIAVILIALFMILNYRFLGFLADITLAIYVLLVIALMKALGAVLTLPGIAGIILSIGMAVDANVLIFERIREEIRSGKTFRGALSVGFSRAFRTVVDSNATTLIAAFALYWFGTGSIRGFAITLSLGILVSLFTAVFVTKVFLDLLSGTKLSHNYPLLNIHERAFSLIRVGNWNIIGKTKLWFTISLVLIIIGVAVAFVNVGVREQKLPLNLGVDFTGGSRLELTTEGDDQLVPSTLKSALATQGLPDSQIQPINEHDVVVRTKELTSEDTNRIMEGLKETFPSIKLVAADYVGPVVGKDLQLNALYAVLVALLGIVIYISIRFQFRYAVATIIALVHDVLIVLGFFAVSFLEANSPLVAVLLTVVGYSVMDTVVTLDRIRENMRFRKREPISEVINRSILQTFTRSMNTTLTTLLAVLSLVIFGGRSILDFSAGLFVGLATGAYSSFFIATPILNIWLNRAELKERARIKSKKK